jgi:hypothetical protein
VGLFTRRIRPNAYLLVQSASYGKDATGKTAETWADLADDVPALVTQVSAARPGDLGNARNVLSATLTGEHAAMARADVRYYVRTTSAYGLTGVYLYVESAAVHGAAGEGRMREGAWYEVKVSTVRTT